MSAIDHNKRRIYQTVINEFRGKVFAFTVVSKRGKDWQLGLVVQDEAGYNPIDGIDWHVKSDAQKWADDLNSYLGLSAEMVNSIITSTMRKKTRR
jgi:hypothetical protein